MLNCLLALLRWPMLIQNSCSAQASVTFQWPVINAGPQECNSLFLDSIAAEKHAEAILVCTCCRNFQSRCAHSFNAPCATRTELPIARLSGLLLSGLFSAIYSSISLLHTCFHHVLCTWDCFLLTESHGCSSCLSSCQADAA